jgi:hypothetical protein
VFTREDGTKYYNKYDWAGTEFDDPNNPTDNKGTTWEEVNVPTNKWGSPDTRNAYLKTKDNLAKFGLARSNLSDEAIARGITPAKARYMDQTTLDFPLYATKYTPYDGTPGPSAQGTDIAFDTEFLSKPITKFEYDRYRDVATINARAIGTGPISAADKAAYGGGKTEYTLQDQDPLFGGKINRSALEKGTVLPTVPYGFNADGTAADTTDSSAFLKHMQDKADTDSYLGEVIDEAQGSLYNIWARATNAIGDTIEGSVVGDIVRSMMS